MIKEVQEIVALFDIHRNNENAAQMEAYMRNLFPFLGIKAPLRREIQKSFLQTNKPSVAWIKVLWELPEREYQLFAVDLLFTMKKKLGREQMDLIEWTLTNKSWWDTVDGIASGIVGYMFAKDASLRDELAEKWINSDNMWLNRTAILFQLRYKDKTDQNTLYGYILKHINSNEFFIQKAIGWALREYSKTNPNSVIEFVSNNALKSLSHREALKWMNNRP